MAQLLDRGVQVTSIVRSPDALREQHARDDRLTVVTANVLELDTDELAGLVAGCHAVASCLGHNMTFRGVFGHPRRLVTEATRRLCQAIRDSGNETPTRFVLMNTEGNRNRDLDEPMALLDRAVIGLVRWLVPPHADNEQAAEFLRSGVGSRDPLIDWAAVRPGSLFDEGRVSDYDVRRSPQRSVIFGSEQTSRINVAHFMAELITNDSTWEQWKGQMPVIYNRAVEK